MHDGFQMVIDAIKRQKSADPAKIRDGIEATTKFVGVNGIYSMTSADHMGLDLSGFRIVEIKKGEWSPIEETK
jgi:branched-chain amino acid transport system substrate-binding protein